MQYFLGMFITEDERSVIHWHMCISPYLQACLAKEGSLFSDVTGKYTALHEYLKF